VDVGSVDKTVILLPEPRDGKPDGGR
jgi:hypothetical protein